MYLARYCWADSEQDISATFAWSGSGRFCSMYHTPLLRRMRRWSPCLLRCSDGAEVHQIRPHTDRSDTFLCKAAVHVWLMCKYVVNALYPSYASLIACVRAVCVCVVNPMCLEHIRLAGHMQITCLLWDWKLVDCFIRFGRFGSCN